MRNNQIGWQAREWEITKLAEQERSELITKLAEQERNKK
jgi:hypothetical protein